MRQFTELEMDTLKEFTNVGTLHAATALSKLLDRKIEVNIPEAKLVQVTRIPDYLGGGDQVIDGLYFRISGGIKGSILLFLHEKDAENLVSILTAGLVEEGSEKYAEIRKSALMELGNILTNSYLNALAEMLNTSILLSVPSLAADKLSSVIDFLLIELIEMADQALMMNTVVKLPDTEVKGSLIVFIDADSLERIFSKAGTK